MEILGRERRRRWSNAEKLDIVAAVGVNGETLARVARRYDVSRSQIYQWRHLRGDNYGGRFSDNYDGRYARPSGLIAGRGEAPTGVRA